MYFIAIQHAYFEVCAIQLHGLSILSPIQYSRCQQSIHNKVLKQYFRQLGWKRRLLQTACTEVLNC